MKINRVVFVWENRDKDIFGFGNINKIDVVFDRNECNPVIFVDAGSVKIEDRSIKINNAEILQKIGLLNLEKEKEDNFSREFMNTFWKLIVNDVTYEGVLSVPKYVSKIKKIIKFDVIFDQMSKKIANYLK